MIRRLLAAIRDMRIAHHDRIASAAGAATLAAQIDRDWAAAGERMREMHAAQAKRDALIARMQPRYSCDPALLAQCRDQMSAAQLVAHHRAGDFADVDWTLGTR